MSTKQRITEMIKRHYLTYYSFVIMPHDHKKYFQLRIRKLYAHITIIILLSLGIYTFGVTFINQKINNEISENVATINVLQNTNQQQQKYISELEDQLKIMNEKLTELESLEAYIRDITDYQDESETENEN